MVWIHSDAGRQTGGRSFTGMWMEVVIATRQPPFLNSIGQAGERQVVAMVMGVLPAKGSSPYKADIQRGAEEEMCTNIRPKATLN